MHLAFIPMAAFATLALHYPTAYAQLRTLVNDGSANTLRPPTLCPWECPAHDGGGQVLQLHSPAEWRFEVALEYSQTAFGTHTLSRAISDGRIRRPHATIIL